MIADEVFYFYIFSGKITIFLGTGIFGLALECRRIFCKYSFFSSENRIRKKRGYFLRIRCAIHPMEVP